VTTLRGCIERLTKDGGKKYAHQGTCQVYDVWVEITSRLVYRVSFSSWRFWRMAW
jgi:hypothetical protein